MNVLTHALIGWTAATAVPRAERTWVLAAAVASDLDGMGIVAELATRHSQRPLYWWSEYHHVVGHNVVFAVVFAATARARGAEPM